MHVAVLLTAGPSGTSRPCPLPPPIRYTRFPGLHVRGAPRRATWESHPQGRHATHACTHRRRPGPDTTGRGRSPPPPIERSAPIRRPPPPRAPPPGFCWAPVLEASPPPGPTTRTRGGRRPCRARLGSDPLRRAEQRSVLPPRVCALVRSPCAFAWDGYGVVGWWLVGDQTSQASQGETASAQADGAHAARGWWLASFCLAFCMHACTRA